MGEYADMAIEEMQDEWGSDEEGADEEGVFVLDSDRQEEYDPNRPGSPPLEPPVNRTPVSLLARLQTYLHSSDWCLECKYGRIGLAFPRPGDVEFIVGVEWSNRRRLLSFGMSPLYCKIELGRLFGDYTGS